MWQADDNGRKYFRSDWLMRQFVDDVIAKRRNGMSLKSADRVLQERGVPRHVAGRVLFQNTTPGEAERWDQSFATQDGKPS